MKVATGNSVACVEYQVVSGISQSEDGMTTVCLSSENTSRFYVLGLACDEPFSATFELSASGDRNAFGLARSQTPKVFFWKQTQYHASWSLPLQSGKLIDTMYGHTDWVTCLLEVRVLVTLICRLKLESRSCGPSFAVLWSYHFTSEVEDSLWSGSRDTTIKRWRLRKPEI